MKLWLKPGAIKELNGRAMIEGEDSTSRWLVQHSGLGKEFVETGTGLHNSESVSSELLAITESVSVEVRIAYKWHQEGIYKHDEAVMIVVVNENPDNIPIATLDSLQRRTPAMLDLSISGPNVEQVRTIYSLFRQGKLKQTEVWVWAND